MNDFDPFFHKFYDWIEHTISMIANIISILCFFGINYSKVKSFIQLIAKKIKIFTFKFRTKIVCIGKDITKILKKKSPKIANNFSISRGVSLFSIVFLVNILCLIPVVYTNKENNIKDLLNDSKEYYASNSLDEHALDKEIIQMIEDNLNADEEYYVSYIFDEQALDEKIMQMIEDNLNADEEYYASYIFDEQALDEKIMQMIKDNLSKRRKLPIANF